MYRALACPECMQTFVARVALHWHLRREHGHSASEAYSAAGSATWVHTDAGESDRYEGPRSRGPGAKYARRDSFYRGVWH